MPSNPTRRRFTDGESTPSHALYVHERETARNHASDISQSYFGAMLFGVETGIIGGVLTMEPFQKDYALWEREDVAKANLEANIGTRAVGRKLSSTGLTVFQ